MNDADIIAALHKVRDDYALRVASHAANRLTKLTRDLAFIDALRPSCPTCGGTVEQVVTQDGMGETIHAHITCPDCVDGKVSIEQLAATWQAVHGDNFDSWYRYPPARDAIDYLRAVRP